MSVQVYSLLAQTEGERKAFLEGSKKGAALGDYPREYLVVIRDEKLSPFVKFEIILLLFCFLLDPLTNKHCRVWSSIINSSISRYIKDKESCCQQGKGLAITKGF